MTVFQNCSNRSAPLNKLAPRAKNRKTFKRLLILNTVYRFWNNFTGRFLGWPSTKIAQTVLLCWTRWPPELKIEKPLNDFFSWTRRWILKSLHRNVTWVTLYQKCSNDFALLNKMAARAINRNKLLTTSAAKSVDRFWNNFTGMFLRWHSTKIAQSVRLHWTRWPPELKNRKTFKRLLLLNQCSNLEIILQEGFLDDPLPKLLKPFRSIEKNGRQS